MTEALEALRKKVRLEVRDMTLPEPERKQALASIASAMSIPEIRAIESATKRGAAMYVNGLSKRGKR
jgi:hypothetical protein